MSSLPKTSYIFTPSTDSSKAAGLVPPSAGIPKKKDDLSKKPEMPMKDQMQEQSRTNVNMHKEIEWLKKSREPRKDVTPLAPRAINFDLLDPPSASYQGSSSVDPSRTANTQPQGVSSGLLVSQHAGPLGSYSYGGMGTYPQGSIIQSSSIQPPSFVLGSSDQYRAKSSKVHKGDFVPMQVEATTAPVTSSGLHIHRDFGSSRMPHPSNGNTLNTAPFTTKTAGLYGTGISADVAK
ncbi:hypothetical protein QVD17_30452 [Tagetes erecta]|uniref:Uncharacterized protein n=1 Tax=Tagetes erecta TaxID=13708 RepID=A0AAD8K5N7_TARER|nr:hypothetical protein QVD17_30452 [Tagetes erecta]